MTKYIHMWHDSVPPTLLVHIKFDKLSTTDACMRGGSRCPLMPEARSYHRHRFPGEIISYAVWLYHVFSLSLRDVELTLAERGVVVIHESIRAWCQKFGTEFAERLRRRRPRPGDAWHLDEVFVRIRGALHHLWRAVDQNRWSWTSWCRRSGMALRPSASSDAC